MITSIPITHTHKETTTSRAALMEQPKQEQDNHTQPGQDPNPENQKSNGIGEEKQGSSKTGSDPIEIEDSANQLKSGSMRKSVHWSPDLVTESPSPKYTSNADDGSNPYVNHSPASNPNFNLKDKVATVKDVLGRWGKKVGEATKKAEDLAGNTWQHLKTGPSFVDAAMGRIAQGTKALAEGGYEKIFRQTFETVPEEQLLNSYACYLSTSAGPVMGTLYVSTAKLAFCSDNPLSYKADGNTEWSYYKVVIPLHQLKAVNPSSSRINSFEKYIQLISVDNHEFWLMGFLNYDGAVQTLEGAFQQQIL